MRIRKIAASGLILLTAAVFYPSLPCTVASSSAGAGHVIATASMSVPRFDQTATLLSNGKVLIAGGLERNGVYHATAELYDPATGKFTSAGSMESRRACQIATLMPSGKVLLAGGADGSWQHLATAELYDPTTGKFTPTGNLTAARCGAEAAPLPNGKVLIVGGYGAPDINRLASAEIYDPSTGVFTATGSMRTPRDAHALAVLQNGKVLVAGGSSAGRFPNEAIESSAELYDPATGRFTPTGSMNIPRYKFAAVTLTDGRVLVIGGSDNRAWHGKYSSAELYDPTKGTFTLAGEMSFKRFKLRGTALRLTNGTVLIAGGAETPEVYDPGTGAFHAVVGSVGDGRYFSTATLLPNSNVLIVGGYGEEPQNGGIPNAWLYRP